VNAAEFPHVIAPTGGSHSAHSFFTVSDVIPYQVNGSKRLWYFYKDTVDGDGNTYDLASSFTIDDANEAAWSTATGGGVLDANFDIIAEVSDNSFMYVANANNLYKFDGNTSGGASGTVSTALTFDSGIQIRDTKDGLGYLWIALLRSFRTVSSGLTSATRSCYVLAWDRKTGTVSQTNSYFVEGASGITSLVFHKGVPHIFTETVRGVDEIRRLEGNSFKVIKDLGTSGGPANRHSVWSNDGLIMWIGTDRYIYAYGSIETGLPEGLFKIGNFSSFYPIKGLANINGSTFFLGGSDGTYNTMFTWIPFGTSGNCTQGNWRSKVYELPKFSEVKSITVFWPPLSGGANANMTLTTYVNNSAAAKTSTTINYQDVPAGDGSRGWKYIPLGGKNFENVNYFQIGLEWATGQSISASIRPIRIEIEYDPSSGKKK